MTQKILRKIVWFQRFGLKSADTKIEKIGSSLFNILLFLVVSMHIFLLFREISAENQRGIIINIVAFSITLLMLVFNYFKKYKLSTAYFNLIYPWIAGSIPLIVGRFDGLDYIFFIFILTGVIFSKTFIARIFYTVYNVVIYLGVTYQLKFYPKDNLPEEQDTVMFFLVTALFIFLITSYFYSEIIKNEKDNQSLVKNLTANNKKLSLLNRELEHFNHIASHDLKTPLRSIMSFSSLIQRDLVKKHYSDVEEYFQFIKDSAQQMHNLITDTLEYSQLEQDNTTKENLDLNKIIADISRQITGSHSEHIEINHTQLPHFHGQKSLLIRLLQNIIENGIKYNRSAHKVIDIDFEIKNSFLVLKIKDNGIGIEEEYLDKIFIQFKRLHNSTEFTGTGLGLPICKKIVEQLKGTIWVDSEIEKGSTFYINLPFDTN